MEVEEEEACLEEVELDADKELEILVVDRAAADIAGTVVVVVVVGVVEAVLMELEADFFSFSMSLLSSTVVTGVLLLVVAAKEEEEVSFLATEAVDPVVEVLLPIEVVEVEVEVEGVEEEGEENATAMMASSSRRRGTMAILQYY